MDVTTIATPETGVEKAVSRPFFSFHLALGAVLCVWAFFFCGKSVADPDLWWHLRNAQYLFSTHHFPRVDMFSFTLPGTPWLDHEWLSEVPYYLAHRAFGLRGVFCLYLVTAELILLGIYFFFIQVRRKHKRRMVSHKLWSDARGSELRTALDSVRLDVPARAPGLAVAIPGWRKETALGNPPAVLLMD